MKTDINFQIIIPSQTKYLSLIGKICEKIAKDIFTLKAARETLKNDLNSVLTEAIVNSIKYGCNTVSGCKVKICISLTSILLIIKVFDSGQGFDFNSLQNKTSDFKQLQEGGRGLQIINELMDSVAYKKSNNGNVLEMRKSLSRYQ